MVSSNVKYTQFVVNGIKHAKQLVWSWTVPLSSNVTSGRLEEELLGRDVQGSQCSSTVGLS